MDAFPYNLNQAESQMALKSQMSVIKTYNYNLVCFTYTEIIAYFQ